VYLVNSDTHGDKLIGYLDSTIPIFYSNTVYINLATGLPASCLNVACSDCPIKYECMKNISVLPKHFSSLHKTNPELFI